MTIDFTRSAAGWNIGDVTESFVAVPHVASLDISHHRVRAGETGIIKPIGTEECVQVVSANVRSLLMSGARHEIEVGVAQILPTLGLGQLTGGEEQGHCT